MPRRPRSDAERNRERLIEVAKTVFAGEGASASLEKVAREAKVGIGTLYRHFPTRDVLIEAVYRQETDMLIAAANDLAETREPMEALREWLLLFVDFLDAKKDMAGALDSLIGGPEQLYSGTPARLDQSVEMLTERARRSDVLAAGIAPMDFLRAIAGVAGVRPDPNWKTSAVQMVEVLLRGAARVPPSR